MSLKTKLKSLFKFKSLSMKIMAHFVLVIFIPLAANIWLTLYTVSLALRSNSGERIAESYLYFLQFLVLASNVVTFLLLLLVSYVVARFLAKRLEVLKHGADEISKGNIDYRLNSENVEDEFEPLYKSFNLMSGFIGDSRGSLSIMVEKLEKALLRERELSQLKSQFVRVISHQMRTPMSILRWNMELFLSGELGEMNAEQSETMGDTYHNTKRMIYVVDDLLTVLDIEDQELMIRANKFDIKKLVNEVMEDLQFMAVDKNIRIVLSCTDEVPETIIGDSEKVKRILRSLLENALYYNDGGGTICIIVSREGDQLRFEFRDAGIGILDEDKEHIGTKFFRGSNASLHRADGSGLGIFLIKEFIKLMGGEFAFTSVLGEGSNFSFTLASKLKVLENKNTQYL
jgi:signal transduction histidine kinase